MRPAHRKVVNVIDCAHASHRDLLELQVATLFLLDSKRRLLAINEPGTPPAPRFFLGRTVHGHRWRIRYDMPASTAHRLDQLCHAEPRRAPHADPPEQAAAIRAVLAEDAPIVSEDRGPAYWLPAVSHVPPQVVLLSEAHAALVQTTFPWLVAWLADAANGPVAAVIAQGSAVSVCFCSRITPHAAEAGIETLASFRGNGAATAAAAGWAAAVQHSQRIALYSTSWQNHASQAVAKKLGAVPYAEDWSIT
jgi:RimJ/RimL family protein N-acetyltransferase